MNATYLAYWPMAGALRSCILPDSSHAVIALFGWPGCARQCTPVTVCLCQRMQYSVWDVSLPDLQACGCQSVVWSLAWPVLLLRCLYASGACPHEGFLANLCPQAKPCWRCTTRRARWFVTRRNSPTRCRKRSAQEDTGLGTRGHQRS